MAGRSRRGGIRNLRANRETIDGVILSAFWAEYWTLPGFQERLRDTVSLLTGEGFAVLLVGPTPQFHASVPRLDATLGARAGPAQRKGAAIDAEISARLDRNHLRTPGALLTSPLFRPFLEEVAGARR